MKSKILMIAGYYLMPILLVFSVFLLFRGHHETGGGFVGGLAAASGIALYIITHGIKESKKTFPTKSRYITTLGLILMLISGISGLIFGGSFLETSQAIIDLPVLGNPGSAFIFDLGVYFVVIGTVYGILKTLIEVC